MPGAWCVGKSKKITTTASTKPSSSGCWGTRGCVRTAIHVKGLQDTGAGSMAGLVCCCTLLLFTGQDSHISENQIWCVNIGEYMVLGPSWVLVTMAMVWYGMVWYGTVWYGVVWYGMVWCGRVRYGTVWYGMVRYGTVQ